MQSEYKIAKHDAAWLKKAVASYKPQDHRIRLNYVYVTDSTRYGHVGVATDGYSLHVINVPTSIPNGYYVPFATGKLVPVACEEQYPQWEQMIANREQYNVDLRVETSIVEIMGTITVHIFDVNGVRYGLDARRLSAAISYQPTFTIQGQRKPSFPIMITFPSQHDTHFALLQPYKV